MQEDELFAGANPGPDLLQQRKEFSVDQDRVILGVIDRAKDLLGREPDIYHVQHRTDHGHREEEGPAGPQGFTNRSVLLLQRN